MKKSTVCSEALGSAYEITKLTKYFPRKMFNSTKLLQNMKMRGVLRYFNFVQHDGQYGMNQ